MSTDAPAVGTAAPAKRRLALIGIILSIAYVVVLAGAWLSGTWLFDHYGRPIANDFVDVWAAGHLVFDGNAAGAYDWNLHKAAEVEAVGHTFDNYYGWHYPPTFFFVAAALAMLPYIPAALTWLIVSLAAYVAAVWRILDSRVGIVVAIGSPAALWNATAGQNGYLSAALIGGTLCLMERQPVLAGVCLGLLSYKPHLGLLFPIALIAGGRWRVFITAAIVALAMIALSLIVFGIESWQAFFEWLPTTSRVVFGTGAADFNRLQSAFGLVRALGGGETLAWSVQTAVAGASVVAVVWLWCSDTDFEMKAAGLSCAALIVTPYLYIYDFVVLTIPAAFLLKLALRRGFFAGEALGIVAAVALLVSYPYVKTQVGLAAAAVIAVVIIHRLVLTERPAPSLTPA